jgi:hypothetical protein
MRGGIEHGGGHLQPSQLQPSLPQAPSHTSRRVSPDGFPDGESIPRCSTQPSPSSGDFLSIERTDFACPEQAKSVTNIPCTAFCDLGGGHWSAPQRPDLSLSLRCFWSLKCQRSSRGEGGGSSGRGGRRRRKGGVLCCTTTRLGGL